MGWISDKLGGKGVRLWETVSVDNLTATLIETNERKDILFKHVATIHKVNTLSLLQNKVSNVLYFHAYKSIKSKDMHRISISELCHYLSYKGHNYAEIKEALLGLIKLVVQWNVLDDSALTCENWSASTVLASASIKSSIVEYSYSYHMRELLADPKVYAAINIIYQANFRSKYGLALYENCLRYTKVGQTPWFDYLLLRDLLGVPSGSYLQYKDFKRRVLDIAIQEVNTYSDVRVEPLFKKVARRVSGIKFEIKDRKKKQKIRLINDSSASPKACGEIKRISEKKRLSAKQHEVLDLLKRNFQLSPQQALWAVKTYPVEIIFEKIDFVRYYSGARSACAVLISALKNDYRGDMTVPEIEQQQFKKLVEEQRDLTLEVFSSRLSQLKKQGFQPEEFRDFLQRFENYMKVEYPNEYSEFYQHGLSKSIKLRKLCYKFCADKFPYVFSFIQDLE